MDEESVSKEDDEDILSDDRDSDQEDIENYIEEDDW